MPWIPARPIEHSGWTEQPQELWTGAEDVAPASLPPVYDLRLLTYSYVRAPVWAAAHPADFYAEARYVNGGQRVP